MGVWTQLGLDIRGKSTGDRSGYSVSLASDGSVVAISTRANNSDNDHVRVYKAPINISDPWIQIGSDINNVATRRNESGYCVSLSSDGSILAIGAMGNRFNSGHVRIYKNISNNWKQIGSDIEIDGEAANDESDLSVSLSSDGSIVAIGADIHTGNYNYHGHVRVYENISDEWETDRI